MSRFKGQLFMIIETIAWLGWFVSINAAFVKIFSYTKNILYVEYRQ